MIKQKHSTEGRKRVLVVEDDGALEHFWGFVLERIDPDMEMVWAESVEEAENLIAKEHDRGRDFDLVIADIYLLGGKTGLQLWEKHRNELGAPPFIVTSSLSTGQFMKAGGSEPGLPCYLQKPLDPRECIPMIEGLLNRPSA
jgi:DNA-binding response OmpR family regulator